MAQTSKFTVQLLEKIGAPLAAAIESVSLQGDDKDIEAAKLMAQMLGQAVQVSISLNGLLNVQEDEAQADSTRLALAALAAPLIADFYTQNERVPEDQDIKRIIKSLESVLAFADNFTAAEEGKSRLATIDHDAPLFDKTQSSLVVMQVLTPVISAVAEFPFGQSEVKLVQDIASRLQDIAADIAKSSSISDKLGELMVLKALASLYAQCHRAQTQKLASTTPDENVENRAELSLSPVWENFDVRVAMIKAVMGANKSDEAAPASKAPVQSQSAAPEISEEPVQTEAPTTPASQPVAEGSPMGFFKKPDANAPAEPLADAVKPESAPAEAAKEPSPAEDPPASPMGFFKPGAKKADESGS